MLADILVSDYSFFFLFFFPFLSKAQSFNQTFTCGMINCATPCYDVTTDLGIKNINYHTVSVK